MNFVSRDVIEPILGRACDIYIFILRSNKVYSLQELREGLVTDAASSFNLVRSIFSLFSCSFAVYSLPSTPRYSLAFQILQAVKDGSQNFDARTPYIRGARVFGITYVLLITARSNEVSASAKYNSSLVSV